MDFVCEDMMICYYTKDTTVKGSVDGLTTLEYCATGYCLIVCWQITEMDDYLQRWDTYQIPQNLRSSVTPR